MQIRGKKYPFMYYYVEDLGIMVSNNGETYLAQEEITEEEYMRDITKCITQSCDREDKCLRKLSSNNEIVSRANLNCNNDYEYFIPIEGGR